MLDKDVAVAMADDQAEPVVEHRQYDGMECNDHQRDALVIEKSIRAIEFEAS